MEFSFWAIYGFIMIVNGSLYALPQAIRSITRHSAHGLSIWFIFAWLMDRVMSLIYVIHIKDTPLTIKYSISVIPVAIIMMFKLMDKKQKKTYPGWGNQ